MWNTFINLGGNCKPVYPNYKKDKCCVIVHTGGTTGTPKGVMLTMITLILVLFRLFEPDLILSEHIIGFVLCRRLLLMGSVTACIYRYI